MGGREERGGVCLTTVKDVALPRTSIGHGIQENGHGKVGRKRKVEIRLFSEN